MKLFPTALHKGRQYPHFSSCGYTTSTFWHGALEAFGVTTSVTLDECDAVCIFCTCLAEYTFDDELAIKIAASKKPIIIFDYSEYGGHSDNHLSQYNLYGYKIEYEGLLAKDSSKLHTFLSENLDRIKCYFKRELGTTIDVSVVPFKVVPLEFVATIYCPDDEPDSREVYMERQCILNFIWGLSNLSRPHLQGAIMKNIGDFASQFAYSWREVQEYLKGTEKFCALIHHPWYMRITNEELMKFQKKSRMVIDLYGAGLKCFRNVESCGNSLSVKQDPSKLVFTYPWTDGVDCIVLPTKPKSNLLDEDRSVEILLKYRHENHHLLYDMYLNSMKINAKYHPRNYTPNHIIKNIQSVL